MNASSASGDHRPRSASTITRCLSCMLSNTHAEAASNVRACRTCAACGRSAPCRRRRDRTLPVAPAARSRAGPRARRCQAARAAAAATRRPDPATCRGARSVRALCARRPAIARARREHRSRPRAEMPRRAGRAAGAAPSGRPNASPSEGAGSVETTSVRVPRARGGHGQGRGARRLADAALAADEHVMRERDAGGIRPVVVLVAFERGFDAGDPVVLRRERRGAGTLPPIPDLAQAREDVRLEHRRILPALISPSSTRICAASSCSRSAVSSFSSVSTAAAILSSTNRSRR